MGKLRDWLDQLNICNVEHKVLATRCKSCRYNLVGFARNYFASVVCYCYQTDKNLICRHCKQLLYDLNFNTIKICIRDGEILKEIELKEIDKYLEMCPKADLFFFFFFFFFFFLCQGKKSYQYFYKCNWLWLFFSR